ncbi:hypothetical protein F8388_001317 [Cannabis sativa]|uniref:Major facilitator superfamily (MFS) profile domain-containing protein n=1 Tax=Cannabis sativa TaxID=3483 RepID=A0A7J6DXF8_CANSA|nr:hypothetical protein F8388_001317 [Cannabis sativa]
MSFRDDSDDGRDLRKPFLHTGSWYRMGSRQSSMMGSTQAIRDSSISVVACVLIVALGPIQFGFTSGFSSPTQAAITKDLGLSVSESLMIAAIPNIIGWLAISFAKDSSFLYMGRLLEGFGVGIISYVVPVYIAEISPQNLRGSLGSVNQLSVTAGIMLAYLLGLFVPWRILAVLGALPCIILIPGLFFIPESPRWLAKMGKTDDFEVSLQVLRGFDADISAEVNDIKRSVASSSKRSTINFAELKQRRYYMPLTIGIGLLVLQQISGINGVLFYSSTIFEAAGVKSGNAATFGLGAIQVLATLVTTWLVDKAGRRLLLIVSSAGMTLSLLVVAVAFYLKDAVSSDSGLYSTMSILSVVGVVAMVVAFSLGVGAIPWIIMSELLMGFIFLGNTDSSSQYKKSSWKCSNSCQLVHCLGVTMTANLLLNWSSGGTFTIYMIVSAFTVIFVAKLVPETKGRTLEEIQSSFR